MEGASPLPSLRLALAALAGAALAGGLAYAAVVLGSGHVDDRGTTAALGLLVGWSFTGAGLVAWWRRPANRVGPLMAAVGFTWFATGVSASDDDVVFTVGIALDALFVAFAVHLLLAFPTGELQSRLERLIVLAGYLIATVLQVPSLLFEARGEPRNLLIVSSDQDLSDLLDALQFAIAVIPFSAAAVILVRRWRTATPPQRRAIAPVVTTGGVALVASGVANGLDAAGARQDWADVLEQLALAAVPFGFLAGLLRSRIAQAGAMSSLMARLGGDPGPDAVRAALAEALGDPSLRLAYWLPDGERFVDADGRPVRVDVGTWSEVERNGSRIAAIGHDPALADEPRARARGRRRGGARDREPAAGGGAPGADRGAARVAGADRRGRRRRAPAARARPARRRAVAAGRAGPQAPARAAPRVGAPRARRPDRGGRRRAAGEPRRGARAGPRHPSGGAHRPRPRRRAPQPGACARPYRSTWSAACRTTCPGRSPRPPTSSSPRR